MDWAQFEEVEGVETRQRERGEINESGDGDDTTEVLLVICGTMMVVSRTSYTSNRSLIVVDATMCLSDLGSGFFERLLVIPDACDDVRAHGRRFAAVNTPISTDYL